MDVVDAVRGFMAKELRVAGVDELDPELALVRRGIIDSLELMQIVQFLEDQYAIEVDETEILPANLKNLSAIAAFVKRKLGAD